MSIDRTYFFLLTFLLSLFTFLCFRIYRYILYIYSIRLLFSFLNKKITGPTFSDWKFCDRTLSQMRCLFGVL